MLGAVFDKAREEGILESLFYDGSVKTGDEFIKEVLRPGSLPFVVMGDGELAACSWLNQIAGRTARVHYAIFRKFHGRRIHQSIGKHLYGYILTRKDAGGHMFDCLYGITPAINPLAWKAALACGWKKTGILPQSCFIEAEGKSVAGIITCATRETLGIEQEEMLEGAWEL